MKKFYFWYLLTLIIIALLPQVAGAQQNGTQRESTTHVTAAQAMDIGYAFMHTGSGSKSGGTPSNAVRKQTMQLVYTGRATDSLTRAMTDCYYVFALQPKGFVIVAADERVEPILGYSYDNNFVVENMPEHVRGWLGNYERQIEAVTKSNIQPEPATQSNWARLKSGQSISIRNGNTVGPLLTTTWNQGQYYNNLCPADAYGPAGHVYTGCVATAMAQIIHYWGYPTQGRGIHSYESNYGMLTVNYGSTNYDYTLMPDALTSASTSQEVEAVATLMRDCGVAVNMGYSHTESSSFDQDARAAFINFYRFSPDLSFAEKAYFSDSDWDAMLHDDLDNGRPIFYSGQGSGGHAFVCDGYNADGYYHFNFGWGGFADGWFLTSSVTPGSSNFSSSQAALFGIVPDSTGHVILGQTEGTSTFIVDEPLEFYHLMGHNTYEGGNYYNSCNNTVNFIPANSTNQIVADILDYEDQTLTFSDGNGNQLRSLVGGNDNDYSPVVSSYNSLNISYSGNMYYAGFKLNISQTDNSGCRMVSNITSFVEAQTVHLTWTENGMATQWEIEYGVKGFALGTGITYTATANTATFNNLPKFTEYDFYIRSICGTGFYGQRNKVTVMVEAEYWQDIVTSQPAGYVLNPSNNTVEISTAEGLAWWAKNPSPKVYLTTDIELSEYKWRPVNLNQRDIIIFDGKGHQITHAYMRENAGDVGLFNRTLIGGFVIIENLGLTNSYVKGTSGKTGGIGGLFMGNCIIRNCYVSNSTIDGDDETGGLFGEVEGSVINCYVNANVIGKRWVGLMIGVNMSSIRNCYAAGTVRHRSSCYIAGITSYCLGDEISNCYSVETEMGVVGYKGGSIITDTSTFVQSNTGWTLITPVIIDDVTETDLLSALNKGVKLYNDSVYCTWTADTGNVNGGYPVFGNKSVVQCPNVTDVSVQNIMVNNNYAVVVSWTENSNASQWRIRYRRHDMPDSVYTYVTATSNPDTIFGIPLGYSYDFNVRAICDANNRSGWSETQTLIVDLTYWTDIVTVQPAGYVEDANGNVEISSAEGLAWLAVITNGLHNQPQNSFTGKTVTLKSDINIEGHRWYPIGTFSGTFDGLNHRISNIYINGTSGLFGFVYLGRVRNVNLIGGSVIGGNGGLIGTVSDGYEISNCHSSATIYGDGGALCGEISNYGTSKIIVSNCSSSGTVYGREGCGNLIGTVAAYNGEIKIRNCYATGNVNSVVYRDEYAWYRGGLIGYVRGGHVDNCYSTGNVEIDNYASRYYGKVIGVLDLNPHVHYLYGQDNVNEGWELTGTSCEDYSNASEFHHNGGTNALLSSVSIEGTTYFDLLDALNAWVISQNDSTLRLWILDSISGYPVFGDYYVPSCYNPTDLTVSQATVVGDPTIKTRLSWAQNGEPDHWEVLYVTTGQSITSGNFGTVTSVNSNPCVLAGIPVGQPLDFYVRAVCGDGDASGWCGPVTYLPDKLHWTEVVTSQPEGFQLDANHNVYISSAEGLSWLSSIVNGLNGAQGESISNIILTKDIDLSAYRWTAIHGCNSSFNGNNHVVTGLYCNELSDYQGLFGIMNGNVCNLILSQCNVKGSQNVGAIAGHAGSGIVNCMVNGDVSGCIYVGGLAGRTNYVENSCFIGDVATIRYFTTSAPDVGYSGGISGYSFNNTIVNCYVAGDFTNLENDCSAIIVCSGFTSMVSNCYYKVTETNLPITNSDQSNNSDFTGSNYTWTLNTPPFINGAFYPDLVDALNAWVDANNTDGRYNRWVADTAMANGGYPIFESVSYPAVITQDTVLASGYYCWHGMVFTSNTTVTDTIPTPNGYDSVITHHIIVTPVPLTEITIDTCSSYTWNGEIYSKTGDYVRIFSRLNDADSVVILHLFINPLNSVDVHSTCEKSYTWIDGITYVANNNTAKYPLTTEDGCDSVVTLHLTFTTSTTSDTTAVAINSFDWYEYVNLTQSGDYTRTLTNANGCDSVVTLHLTIITPPTVTTNTVSNIRASSAFCGGNVTADGGAEVTERGVCWSTSQNPTIADSHIAIGMGTGTFTVNITDLSLYITYHVRAYATNSAGTAYGEDVTFTTTETPSTYLCGDNLIVGGNIYTTNQYGSQCWMMQNLRNASGSEQFDYPDVLQACPTGWHLPDNSDWGTLGNNLPSSPVNFGDGNYWTSTFMPWQDAEGNPLTLIAPPYVQSNSVSFTGIACEVHNAARYDCIDMTPIAIRCLRDENASATLPSVTTDTVFNITPTSATCVCNVTDDGGTEVTERGICWNTSLNPTVVTAGMGTGTFTIDLADLNPDVNYTVRAYATNSAGTAYSKEVTFTTTSCTPIPIIISDSVLCEGGSMLFTMVVSAVAPGSEIFYTWYKNNVIIENESSYQLHASETGFYKVVVSLDGCSTESEEVFVNERSAPQLQLTATETDIFVGDATTIMAETDNFNGGDNLYSWSNGHTGSTYTFVPDHIGSFTFDVTVTNTLTGCESSSSITINVHDPSSRYSCGDDMIINGNIYTTQQYGSQCWMMQNMRNANGSYQFEYPNVLQACPTGWHMPDNNEWNTLGSNLPSSPVVFDDGDYWTSTLTTWLDDGGNLFTLISPPYVQSNNVTYPGSACEAHDAARGDCVIHTPLSVRCLRDENASTMLSIVKTDTVFDITATSATCVGKVTDEGGSEVTERGICWSTSSNPTVATAGAGTGTFTINLTDLTPNTTYHVRAYATNSAGTAYGDEVTFTTGCNPVDVTITSDKTAICESECATLNAFGADNYIWSIGENSSTITDCPTITTTYSVTGFNLFGCESTASFTLMVIDLPATPIVTVDNATVCDGGSVTLSVTNPDPDPSTSYTWYRDGAVIPNASQAIIVDYPTIVDNEITAHVYSVVASHYNDGCVSEESEPTIVTVDLTSNTELFETACDSYLWNDSVHTESGDYTRTATTARGCDSVVTLHLTINHPVTKYVEATVYDSYIWDDDTLTESGEYNQTYIASNGCDSVVTLHLTINYSTPPTVTTSTVSDITAFTAICGGTVTADGGAEVTERGVCWSTSTNPTIADAHTSDGTDTGAFTSNITDLTPNTTYYVRAYATSSAGTAYGEEVTFTTECNPVNITISSDKEAICEGECATLHAFGADSYIWSTGENSSSITDCPTATTSYSVTGFDLYGCESATSFTLMVINLPATPVVTVDNGKVCIGGEITLSVTNPDTDPSTSYTWYRDGAVIPNATQAIIVAYPTIVDNDITNHVYSVVASHYNGNCVSGESEPTVVTVNLTSNTELLKIACDSYTWNDSVYTESGNYTRIFTAANGCDSVVTLHLTVNYSNSSDTTAVVCDGFDWYEHTDLTQSGDYTHTFTNTLGCDSVVTLHLTVNHSNSGDTTAVVCNSFDWHEQTNLTQSGDYTRIITNASGCDSVVTLHLMVNHSTFSDTTAVAHNSFDWYEYTNLTQSGDYMRTLMNANGCDSVVTLHLSIITPPTVTTSPVNDITAYSALCGGNVISNGGAEVTERGVCWATTPNPTIDDNHITESSGTGPFTSSISGLIPNTTYHVRAYATNSVGTAYGEEMTFTTATTENTSSTYSCGDNLIVGGYIYTTNQYGSQCWMTQNLRNANGSYQFDYPDIMQACPTGWHLPDNSEWGTLGSNLPSSLTDFGDGDYWTTTYLPWQDEVGNQFTLISSPYVHSNSVDTQTGYFCEVHDAAQQYCCNHTCISVRCLRDENASATLPTVITDTIINITANSATCVCNVTNDGGTEVTERGICWSTSANPTIVAAGAGTGTFTINLIDLTPNTTYHVRAYATNSAGTAYGDEVMFTTGCNPVDVTITPDKTAICEGECATLYASGADSYIWNTGENSSTITDCPTITTTYSVTGFNIFGCESTTSFALMVIDLPATPLVTVDNNVICDGGEVMLSITNPDPNPLTLYTWYRNGIVIPGATHTNFVDMPTTIVGETANFTYNVVANYFNSGCYSSSSALTVTVNDVPATPVLAVDNANVFEGAEVTVSVTNPIDGAVYTWYRNGVILEGVTQTVFVDYLTAINGETTNYAYSVVAVLPISGCVSNISASTVVTVNALPTATVTVEGNTVLCNGGSTTLHVDVASNDNLTYSYQWYVDGVLIPDATYADYVVVKPIRDYPYNFMVVVSAMNGGFNITAHAPAITVVPAPMVTAFISDTAICEGGTVSMTAWVDGNNSGEGYNLQWFRETPGVLTAEPVGTDITYTTTGNELAGSYIYWLEVTNEYGCSSQSDPVMLTINQPTTGIDVQTVCGSYTWIDGITYTESNNTATYTLTNAVGCDSVVTLHLTVNDTPPTPVVTVDNANIFEGAQLTVSVTNPIDGAVYTWYRNGVIIEGATQAVFMDTLTTIDGGTAHYTYSVFAVLPTSGCVSNISSSTMVTVNPLPVAMVTVEGNTVLCEGNSVTLHADVAPYNDPTYVYQWYDDGVPIPSATSADYVVLEPARTNPYNFMVMVSGMNGSFNITANAPAITVMPSPTVVASISESTICVGGTATLTATVEGGVAGINGYNFQWYGIADTSMPWPEVVGTGSSYTTSGDEPAGNYPYWVTVSDEYGCSSQSGMVILAVVSQPAVTITRTVGYGEMVCEGGSTAIQANVTGGYGELSYQWYENGYILTDETNQFLAINNLAYGVNDTYTVMVAQTGAGCSNSASADINTLVSVYPSYTVAVSGPNDICVGGDLTMFAEVNNVIPGDMLSYQWHEIISGQDLLIEGANSIMYTAVDLQSGSLYEYYVVVNSNLSGCTATSSVHVVNVNALSHTNLYETSCEYYTWNDMTYSASGEYTQTFTNSAGCDSIVTLHLTVNTSTEGDTTATVCGSFSWYEYFDLTQSGDYTHMLTNSAGCDSVVTLHLTVNTPTEGDTTAIVCGSFSWYEYFDLAQSGDYTHTLINAAGCDSVVTLHLTVNIPTEGDTTAIVCGNFSWYEYSDLTQSGDYTHTLTNSAGCDSIVILHLTVNTPTEGDTTAIVCDSFSWYEYSDLTQSGDYTHTLTNAAGCDSVVTLHLTVNTPTEGDTTAIVYGSFSWYEYSDLTQSGDYTHTLTNSAGCDSIVTLHLTVNAQWQVDSYDLNVNQVTGGTITMTVSYVDETSPGTVNSFSTTTDTSAIFESWIQLSADADYGYDFVDFLVITSSGDTLETPNNGFTMPAENVTVTAVFTLHNFNITVNVGDETPWGTVTGSGIFAYGSTDTLTATPMDEHHIFVGWSDYNTENPRVITVTHDSTITAYFVPEEIEIIGNDTVMGSVSVNIPGGGHLTPSTPIVITATPEPHYHFVSWSDGNTDNPRTIFPIQAIGLTAVFAIDQHTITVLSNDYTWGEVIGGGIYDYGTEISICANALAGYEFLSWGDGNTDNPRHITVEQDSAFTAIFQLADGINVANMSKVTVYSYTNQIVVVNAEGFSVEIFDMSGRLLVIEQNVSQSVRKYTIATDGIYLVKVGKNVFKKVKISR